MDQPDEQASADTARVECLKLLDMEDRTLAEDKAMIGVAHAVLKHSQATGELVEEHRGNVLVARAYIAAGLIEPALEFARRTMDITAKHHEALPDTDRATAKEIAARAWALAGNLERAEHHRTGARMLGEAIGDEAERQAFLERLRAGPWFRLEIPEE